MSLRASMLGLVAACALMGCAGATPREEAPPRGAVVLDAGPVTEAPSQDPDNDGLLGEADHCPREAEDCDGFEDEDGCPEIDNDHDGVADACDKCPEEPETYNGRYDDDGCPESHEVVLQSAVIRIPTYILFARNRTAPLPVSNRVLDAVVDVLQHMPNLTRLGIVGHASHDERNATALSESRARAVMAMLVQKGIAPARLEIRGVGDVHPIDENTTEAQRARNRRVEFAIVDTADGPVQRWDGNQYVNITPPSQPPSPTPIDPLAGCSEARNYMRRPGGCGSR